jgi:hypothetical protein
MGAAMCSYMSRRGHASILLANLNADHSNERGLDLGDETNKVAF